MHVVRNDELEDIVLEGRTLVSDDPKDWIVPAAMRVVAGREDFTADIFDWWEKLAKVDQALHQIGGASVGDVMHEMRTEWQSIYGSVTGSRFEGDGSNLQGRKLVHKALLLGLTLAQVANLFGITSHEVLQVMYQGELLNEDEIERYLKLEGLLREASCTWKAAGVQCGFSQHRVQTFADRLGIPPTNGKGRSLKNPPHIKAKALELLDEGMQAKEVTAWINLNMGGELKPMTVHQWAHRTGRTKPRTGTVA